MLSQQEDASQSIAEARERLKKMEEEVVDELAPNRKGLDLEEAVRMLMVTMHSCQQLPSAVTEAASAVVNLLPNAEVSQEAEEVALDGPALAESLVPPARLDSALPMDVQDANVKECWETAIGEIAAIDAGSDADLLAWARSVKSSIRANPYEVLGS